MVLVRGHDTYTKLQFTTKPNTDAWGTIASSPSWETVPLVGEGLVIRPFAFARSQELGNTGEVTSHEQGRQFVEGEFTVYPRYNATWFWKLIANAFGGAEERTDEVTVAGTSVSGGAFSTHNYAPQSFQCATAGSESGVASGLSLRVWRSGPDTSGYVDKIAGATVTGFTWNQPEDDLPTVTFRILATAPTTSLASGEGSLAAVESGTHQVKVRDLSRTGYTNSPSLVLSDGNTLNIRSFSITVNGNYEIGAAPMTDPDNVDKPGHIDLWSITGELSTFVEQGSSSGNAPYGNFLGAFNDATLRVRYASSETVTTSPSNVYYAIDINMPRITYLSAGTSVSSGGANTLDASFECARYYSVGVSNTADLWRIPIHMQTHIADSEDGSAVMLTASHGGNNLNTDLEG